MSDPEALIEQADQQDKTTQEGHRPPEPERAGCNQRLLRHGRSTVGVISPAAHERESLRLALQTEALLTRREAIPVRSQ
jgi:hypothetical protein